MHPLICDLALRVSCKNGNPVWQTTEMKPDHIAKVASTLQVLKTKKNSEMKKAKQTKGKPKLGGSGKGGQQGGGYDRFADYGDDDDFM
jgi:hypothetical protein